MFNVKKETTYKKVQDINDQLGIERKGELVYAMPCPFVICKMAEIIINICVDISSMIIRH